MPEKIYISIIIPFYNSETHIENCLNNLGKINFKNNFEIIMINDGSKDNSLEIIKNSKIKNLKIYSLDSNHGPAKARNLGIKYSKGEYLLFLDVDDQIEENALDDLYDYAIQNSLSFVFCDTKWIEKSHNQRQNIFSYDSDRIIDNIEILELMKRRIFNSIYAGGVLGAKAKLIKKETLELNKVYFEERLRYLEDEIFIWDLLAVVKKIGYIKKQHYIYNVNPNLSSGVIAGLNANFDISKFKIIKSHIQNSFRSKRLTDHEIKKFGDQTLIYFIINVLISYSKSIEQKKVSYNEGIKGRRKIINSVLNDAEACEAINNYKISSNENKLIPFAIKWKLTIILEFLCTLRARKILNIRRKN